MLVHIKKAFVNLKTQKSMKKELRSNIIVKYGFQSAYIFSVTRLVLKIKGYHKLWSIQTMNQVPENLLWFYFSSYQFHYKVIFLIQN